MCVINCRYDSKLGHFIFYINDYISITGVKIKSGTLHFSLIEATCINYKVPFLDQTKIY